MSPSKKILIILVSITVIIAGYFLVKAYQDEESQKIEKDSTFESLISPYEKAKELKDEYFSYNDVMERLERLYPDRENLLSEQQTKQLFPELWIGKSISCQAIRGAAFRKDAGEDMLNDEITEVKAELTPGTDTVSIKVNPDETISFLTGAYFELGGTEGSKLDIVTNNEYVLIAVDVESDKFLDTFTLSKVSGKAIWQSVNAAGVPMSYKVPEGEMYYMECSI